VAKAGVGVEGHAAVIEMGQGGGFATHEGMNSHES
jgi:hypothetical protein